MQAQKIRTGKRTENKILLIGMAGGIAPSGGWVKRVVWSHGDRISAVGAGEVQIILSGLKLSLLFGLDLFQEFPVGIIQSQPVQQIGSFFQGSG